MDLDQSGHSWQRLKVYLGPSLGWADQQVQPSTPILIAGSYVVQPGDSLLLVNVAGLVTIQLPDVRAWMQQTAYQPGTAFDRSITVKDIGGNAANFNITVNAFGSQLIDNTASSVVLNAARVTVKFVPLNDFSGWIEEIAVPSGGGGGGGDVFKAGNNTFTGTNTFQSTITVPTVSGADNSTNAASTAWVTGKAYITATALVPYAPLVSPGFSGTPTAPTPGPTDNSTTLATTAFVKSVIPTSVAPNSSQYALATSDAGLPNGRVLTSTATVTWDFSTPGQAKANTAAGGGNVSNVGTPTNGQLAIWTAATTIQGVTTLPAANEPAHTGDVTNTAGSLVLTIGNAVVTYAKMQNVSATRVLGNASASPAAPAELTLSQTLDMIGGATQGDILYRGASTWARLGAGASGQFLQTQGAAANPLWATAPGGGTHSISVKTFTASGTYTPTAGINTAIIECVAGGGGGGGAIGDGTTAWYGGGGGASGGYSRRVVTAAMIGASQAVTVGAGGSGVVGGNGNPGQSTSVGSLCIAIGGLGGSFGSSAQTPLGGTPSATGAVGDLTNIGNYGTAGIYYPTPSGGLSMYIFGKGADSAWGPGGPPPTASGSGANASGIGGGGAGGLAINTAGSAAGGIGGNGKVVITEYIGT